MEYTRRSTSPAHVDKLVIGGDAPIVIQSMTNVDTNNIEAGVAQTLRLQEAGADLVRFTAQGVKEARALGEVKMKLKEVGCDIPLVADIHFNPKAAYEAAKYVEKVRINPGNFYDPARKFINIEYSEEEYAEEVRELQASFEEFLTHCKQHHTAIRIGVNHGSLSDRIMSHYGDTPEGMVESCMEFLSVCQRTNFNDVVISIKSSNPLVMTKTVRLLVKRMESESMAYPLHLGVTEAGDGEDGRIKSAVGIGALLTEGIGDTIRVSLSEEPEYEIPVARCLVEAVHGLESSTPITLDKVVDPLRTEEKPLVIAESPEGLEHVADEERPDLYLSESNSFKFVSDLEALEMGTYELTPSEKLVVMITNNKNAALMLRALDLRMKVPYIIGMDMKGVPAHDLPTLLGFHLGGALMRGQGSGIYLRSESVQPSELNSIAFGLLQASRRRISRTEYISCPGCGRTLFDLQSTVAKVKEATNHLRGLKIGVMGCIVNGPGEMADADYGYVGAGPGRISLYKQKECIRKGIPQEEAVSQLIELIKEHGDWHEPEK
ncbi:(E)-4-hydroxy-3-methylbut-2-enyl-diphosphate synthase [Porphyromonadaceae bacterium W3.11]|nr:(E)-4-hydroxy-3-methylbut-2-enyl-diphosphate synthase [Porphyromonadaceae bacterium W3.11]